MAKRYAALLRGVNVGGRNKLPMGDLRELFESLGHDDVQTYIQSGNVVFSSSGTVEADALEQAIHDRFGLRPSVVLRTAPQLRAILEANPFPDADEAKLHVGFMAGTPSRTTVKGLDLERFQPDEVEIAGANLYLHLPNGLGRAKLPPYLDRKLGTPLTIRNWATVGKVLALAGG